MAGLAVALPPAVPEHCRRTPQVSSSGETGVTADQHPALVTQLTADKYADVVADPGRSQSARRSSRCIPSGHTPPACSASVHPFFRPARDQSGHTLLRHDCQGG